MGTPYPTLKTIVAALVMLTGMSASSAWATPLPSLQPLIDAAKPGDVVTPPPGIYAGPLLIDKALTLDGAGQVTIDNTGMGSVCLEGRRCDHSWYALGEQW
jgi:nitrous oxidase accessory protein